MKNRKSPFKPDEMRKRFKLPVAARRRRLNRRRPINVLASFITLLNLYCGIAAIFAALEGTRESANALWHFEKAAYFILAAIVVDMLDGAVARMTRSASEFGKQLDSLCDVVSFGVAPAVLLYGMFLPGEQGYMMRTGALIAIIYACCTALRLARFNVFQAEIREYFIGLPSPAAAGTVSSFVLFSIYSNFTPSFWLLGLPTLLLAGLMVSTVQYPKNKMKSLLLAPRMGFRILALCAVAIAVIDQARSSHPAVVLFPLAAAYCLFGIGDTVYRKLFRRVSLGTTGVGAHGAPPPSPPSKSGDLL